MSEIKSPHHPAAFINALAEEGTKSEAIEFLQEAWNDLCECRKRIRELNEQAGTLAGYGSFQDWKWTPLGEHIIRLEKERDEWRLRAESAEKKLKPL